METLTVYGPPGTGKTSKLVEFADEEIRHNRKPLFLSYTRAAAAEATSRLPQKSIKVSTLHSMAFNAMNVAPNSVINSRKLAELSNICGIPFKGGEEGVNEAQEGDEYLAVLSYARNTMAKKLEPVYDRFGRPGTADRFKIFVKAYQDWKNEFGYWDFDDMLFYYASPKFRTMTGPAVVFLDEAQDCSPLQWAAFEKACSFAQRVYIAGDDDQAIYEWNGADPHGMASFTERSKGGMMVLSKSHRLPLEPYNLATRVIGAVSRRVQKVFNCRDADGEVRHWGDITDIMYNIHKIAPNGALILVRDRFKLAEVQRIMNQELVPYDVYGGMSPWTSKVARELRAGTAKLDEVPIAWREFYAQVDLSLPIKYHLSTVHSAKGREHESVIVDLSMPARVLVNTTVDEDAERRVQYVSLTRTKEMLHLCGENPLV